MTSAPTKVLGIDLGGTRVKGIVLSADGVRLAEETRFTTDEGDDAWRESVRAVCRALRTRVPDVTRAGLCAPGLASRDERSIAVMPSRLRGLQGLVWSEWLELPTFVLNDAHAALLGEVWLGAARGLSDVLMLTLGTGVGGAAIVDGRLLRGHLGRAGHVGHVSLDPDGPTGITGTPGSLEEAMGDKTIARRTGGRFSTTREMLAAAENGDPIAREAWRLSVHKLAAALAGLINVLDPHTIVIGGGIAEAKDALFVPLRAEIATMEWRIGAAFVALIPATLGPQAGAYGAAWRALQSQSFHDTVRNLSDARE